MNSTLASEILETVPLIMRVIRGEMRRQRSHALSVAEFRALLFVGKHERTNLSDLAEHIGLSLPSTSKIMDALVREMLVIRSKSTKDRRHVALNLTTRGKSDLQRARAATETHLTERVNGLSPASQKEIIQALRVLRKAFTFPEMHP